uniref:RING-type domain-containing protein n=1 Tax=Meloidogyne javanica TaxID=6303 RepID=A0A915N4I5_MELJA
MTRYYCHKCNRQCNVTNDDFGDVRCTGCNDTFVEEIQSSGSSPATPTVTTMPPFGGAIPVNENPFGGFPDSPFSRLFSQAFAAAGSSGPPNPSAGRDSQDIGGPSSRSTTSDTGRASRPGHASRPRVPPTQNQQTGTGDEDPMAVFIQSIFAGLGQTAQRAQREGSNQGAPNPNLTQGSTPARFSFVQIISGPDHEGGGASIFAPNTSLQDYAWGTNGLDNILTALLNQVADQEQNTALRPEDIKRLPITKVTQEHCEKGTQCTTCMETFALDEEVAQLNCKHIFHKACIEPWLQRKNTCPICRTTIDPSEWGPHIADIDELD